MLARGKMDGAWAFWQHRCRSRWQLLDSEEEHRERTRRDRDAGRIRKREGVVRVGSSSQGTSRSWRTQRQPPPYVRPRRLFFCPLSFSSFLATTCDIVWRLRGAAPRYSRDLCRANCIAANNNRAVLRSIVKANIVSPSFSWFFFLISMDIEVTETSGADGDWRAFCTIFRRTIGFDGRITIKRY